MTKSSTKPDLIYNGTKLHWDGLGSWNASSGLPGYQEPKYQNLRDKGPIPEGLLRVPLAIGGNAKIIWYQREGHEIVESQMDRKHEIQSLQCIEHPWEKDQVVIFEQWGSNRVRLKKVSLTYPNCNHRAGFYLHDSTKGFSHGCIEVDTDFFRALRDYSRKHFGQEKSLLLEVKYIGDSTYGNTYKDQEVIVQCD